MSELRNLELLGSLQHTGLNPLWIQTARVTESRKQPDEYKTLGKLLEMISPGSAGEADAPTGQV